MPRIRTLIATAVVAAATLVVPATALAKGTDVIRTGDCTGTATAKLKVGLDNGRIDLEFEVDSNKVGQTWRVKIKDNGVLRYNALRTTQAPSGSFTVDRRMANMAGTDQIVARARNVTSGQVCVAKLDF